MRLVAAENESLLDTTAFMPKRTSIAKITRPKISGVYERQRLFKLLDSNLDRPVTWISGPAGSGKTSLVASYLDSRKLPCLWYQVDEGDSDIATFFYYMSLAGKKAGSRKRKPLPLLTPEYLLGIPTFTKRYFENLYGRLKPPFIVVFDNYQQAPEDSVFHEVIANGLSATPEGVQVIVISRSAPPQALARLRASNAVGTIGWEELRLTLDESKGILELHGKKGTPEDSIRRLHEKTEGWAAGLVLIMEHAVRGAEEIQTPGTMTREDIFDYFAGELFDRLERESRAFLLMTSFFPRMTAGIAEKLTGQNDAGRILLSLNRNNFFTEKHSTTEPVFQYHPLFREFLLSKITEEFDREQILDMRKRAALLLEETGQTEDAARLFLDAEDWNSLARLVLTRAQSLISQGRGRTLEEWLSRMPGENIDRTPWLCYWLGACKMAYDLRESRAVLEKAFAGFKQQSDTAGLYLSWTGIVNTFAYEWGDFTPLDRWIAEIGTLLRDHPKFPSPAIEAQVTAGVFHALMYRQPHHPDFPVWEERARQMVFNSDNNDFRIAIAGELVLYYTWWLGDQARAALLLNALGASAISSGAGPLALIAWKVSEAAYLWMTGDTQGCLAGVKNGLRTAETTGVHACDFMLLIQGAFGSLTAGDLETADGYLKDMALIFETEHRTSVSTYNYFLGWRALCVRDFPLALQYMRTCVKLTRRDGAPLLLAFPLIGLAEALIELREFREAKACLEEARRIGISMNSNTIAYQYFWAEAFRCLEEGDTPNLLRNLRDHLVISRQCNILNHACWRSSVMSRLYAQALEAGIEADHVRKIIRTRNIASETPLLHAESWPWPIRIYTLGKFEIVKNDKPVRFSKKAPKKPLEALKALIAFGGKNVREEQISEALWPDAEGDAARKALSVTLVRLRELLGEKEALQVSDGAISLDERRVWTDALAFRAAFDRAAEAERAGKAEESVQGFEQAISLFCGFFLAGEDAPWCFAPRERYRTAFLDAVETLGSYREKKRQWRKAIEVYSRGIGVDDLLEKFYVRIIHCLLSLGSQAEALGVYHRLQKTCRAYGIKPSPEIRTMYTKIVPKRSGKKIVVETKH